MSCKEQHIHSDQCDHSDGPDRGSEYTLYSLIDLNSVRPFNLVNEDAAKLIFKPWDDRFSLDGYIESDADEQIILFIPFTGNVKLKSISLLGFNDESQPSVMKVYINREDIDFDSVEEQEPTQQWNLVNDTPAGIAPEYPTKVSKFTNVRNLTLFFPGNFGSDSTRLSYIGFKGEYTAINKDPIITVYELAANPSDHKNKSLADNLNSKMIQ
jgi:hypothetical protein